MKAADLCELCTEKQKQIKEAADSSEEKHENPADAGAFSGDDENREANPLNISEISTHDENNEDAQVKIKHLELELARVKLELVDAQCKNQELDHILKTHKINGESAAGTTATNSSISSNANSHNTPVASTQVNQTQRNSNADATSGIMSSSTSSLNYHSGITNMNTITSTPTALNGSNNSINNNPNSGSNNNNNWLSKTLTQFKEATNQVVQKAQKVNKTLSIDTNNS